MKFKARVKSIKVDKNGNKTIQFEFVEKVTVCNKQFYLAIDKSPKNSIKTFETEIYNVKTENNNADEKKALLDFISQHSKETLIVTVDGKKVTEVELIYG